LDLEEFTIYDVQRSLNASLIISARYCINKLSRSNRYYISFYHFTVYVVNRKMKMHAHFVINIVMMYMYMDDKTNSSKLEMK